MASRILLMSLGPLCSPWRMFMLLMTFFQPASSLSRLIYFLRSSSFWIFWCALSLFSYSFLFLNYSSCLCPSCCLPFLSCHSLSYVCENEYAFLSEDILNFFLFFPYLTGDLIFLKIVKFVIVLCMVVFSLSLELVGVLLRRVHVEVIWMGWGIL